VKAEFQRGNKLKIGVFEKFPGLVVTMWRTRQLGPFATARPMTRLSRQMMHYGEG